MSIPTRAPRVLSCPRCGEPMRLEAHSRALCLSCNSRTALAKPQPEKAQEVGFALLDTEPGVHSRPGAKAPVPQPESKQTLRSTAQLSPQQRVGSTAEAEASLTRSGAEQNLPWLFERRQQLKEERASLQREMEALESRWRDRAILAAFIGSVLGVYALVQWPGLITVVGVVVLAGAGLLLAREVAKAVAREAEEKRRRLVRMDEEIRDVDRHSRQAQRLITR